MSKLNINKNEWLELVFEGKNKEYGAYQLRQEDGKTTMKAFFSALALLTALSSLAIFMSSFKEAPVKVIEVTLDGTLKFDNIKPKTELKTENATAPKTEPVKKNLPPVVVKQEDAPLTEVPRNEDLPKNTSTNTNTAGTPSGPETSGTGTVITIPEPEADPMLIISPAAVEKSPEFPGGISEFLKLVGNRFKAPEMEEEKIIKVLVYFVVEKDGTLTNISVPRSPGYGLDKEAIRVLKSIKTKWDPGIYKGKPVRTSYTLPITIKINSY